MQECRYSRDITSNWASSNIYSCQNCINNARATVQANHKISKNMPGYGPGLPTLYEKSQNLKITTPCMAVRQLY